MVRAVVLFVEWMVGFDGFLSWWPRDLGKGLNLEMPLGSLFACPVRSRTIANLYWRGGRGLNEREVVRQASGNWLQRFLHKKRGMFVATVKLLEKRTRLENLWPWIDSLPALCGEIYWKVYQRENPFGEGRAGVLNPKLPPLRWWAEISEQSRTEKRKQMVLCKRLVAVGVGA